MSKNFKKSFYLIGVMVCLAVLLPEVQQLLAIDMNDGCMLAVGGTFLPLKWDMGRNNMAGYKGHLLFVPESAAATVPTVPDPAAATDNKDMITAKGAFAFTTASGLKNPIYLYSTDAEVEYKADQQGETDGISYKCTLSFFFPGSTPELHAFAALIKNTRGYFVFEDVDGQQFLLGQPGLCASVAPSFNGGKKRSDRRGMSFTATCDSNYSAILMGTPLDIRKIGGYEAAVAI